METDATNSRRQPWRWPCRPRLDGLAGRPVGRLDDWWARADVELDGDPEVPTAAALALFHLIQAGPDRGGIAPQGPDRDKATTATLSGPECVGS